MRQIVNLNKKWAFSKEAAAVPASMPENWYWVNLPHTWNDIDGQDGNNDLYRGTAFYAKQIEQFAAHPQALGQLDSFTVLRMINLVTGAMMMPVTKEMLMDLNAKLNEIPLK